MFRSAQLAFLLLLWAHPGLAQGPCNNAHPVCYPSNDKDCNSDCSVEGVCGKLDTSSRPPSCPSGYTALCANNCAAPAGPTGPGGNGGGPPMKPQQPGGGPGQREGGAMGGGGGGGPASSSPHAAPLLGDVGFTTVPVLDGYEKWVGDVAGTSALETGENIYGQSFSSLA